MELIMNEIIKNDDITTTTVKSFESFTLSDLENSVKFVYSIMEKTKYTECALYMEIADRVAKDKTLYTSRGFEKVDDYFMAQFGKSSTYVYRMANVARSFFNIDGISTMSDGETTLARTSQSNISVFADEYGVEYNVSALAELMQLNVTYDENGKAVKVNKVKHKTEALQFVKDFCTENGIDSTTSQNAIRKLVSAHNTPTVDTTASENATENGIENGTENVTEKPLTDLDRINAILEIVKSIENESCRDAIIKPLNAWSKKFTEDNKK